MKNGDAFPQDPAVYYFFCANAYLTRCRPRQHQLLHQVLVT